MACLSRRRVLFTNGNVKGIVECLEQGNLVYVVLRSKSVVLRFK